MAKKILLVDDEPEILEICRDYLNASSYDVVTARDGAQGLSAFRRERPDLIVLDLMMPEMDGLDVCRAVRRESNVPIIMLTARVEETDKLIAFESYERAIDSHIRNLRHKLEPDELIFTVHGVGYKFEA